MNEVQRIHDELSAMGSLLKEHGEMSDQVAFNELSAKTMVLSAASYFEKEVTASILTVARETGSHEVFCNFISKQGLHRKFHSMFTWDAPNANSFFGLFGRDVKDSLSASIQASDELKGAVKEFMFLGRHRNELVHGNFAAITAEVTFDEAFEKFKVALKFVKWFPDQLREACRPKEEAAVGG